MKKQTLLKMRTVVDARSAGATLREAGAAVGLTAARAGQLIAKHKRISQHPANVGRDWFSDWLEGAT